MRSLTLWNKHKPHRVTREEFKFENLKIKKMKTFTSIQEWVDSNPSAKSQEIILKAINRNVTHELRVEQYYLNQKLRKIENAKKLLLDDSELALLKQQFELNAKALKQFVPKSRGMHKIKK
jgi:hypothetical protein